MEHDTSYISTYDMIIEILIRIFELAAGRITLNISKVFTAAFTVGFFFCMMCLEGPYTGRACFAGLVCFIAACFFGALTCMLGEMTEDYEEDEF
jgi:hypothetical protein